MLILKFCFLGVVICGSLIGLVTPLLKMKNMPSDYKLICSEKSIAGDIPVRKFQSQRTGMHITFAQVKGPMVNGYFTVVTEASDDDGLPHVLEHLIFLGSEDYPYKGVLDLLANRLIADGTNAWTAVDHTAYTVTTAGKEGFLNHLPIFLDHLLYPKLTDAGFITEVYHVTGKGEDAGVVYAEMQARENTGSALTYDALTRALYPQPSGYRYETGGKLHNLRNNITNEKVRNYHKAMYRPENLNLIITGQVQEEEVFQVLKAVEDKIISKGKRDSFSRPWSDPLPPFTESKNLKVVYPSDSEDTGIVRVGWRGPSTVWNLKEYQSVSALLDYLTESSVSPLPKVFVEVEDPLASYVYGYMLEYSISSCSIIFGGVPVSKIDEVAPLLMDTLKGIADNSIPFDLKVMRDILNNFILNEENQLESHPSYAIAEDIITEQIYGGSCQYMHEIINQKEWLEELLEKPSLYWVDQIKKYLLDAPSVVVRGVPSKEESKRLQVEEKERVERRKEELGEDGLKQLEERIAEAKKINEIPPPESMLESVPVPSTDDISYHRLKAYTNIENHQSGLIATHHSFFFNIDAIPVKMQADDIDSKFIQLVAILDTSGLSASDRLYLPLIMELLMETSVMRDGQEVPSSEVIKELNADTLTAETIKGLYLSSSTFSFNGFSHNVGLNFEFEMSKYETVINWLRDILFGTVFHKDRVSVKATKLLNSIGDEKRSGGSVLNLMYNDIVYKKDTNVNLANVLRQEKFLKEVVSTLDDEPDKVITDLNNIYKNLTQLNNIVIHLAANIWKVISKTNMTKPWMEFADKQLSPASKKLHVIGDWEQTLQFDETKSVTGYITGIGSVESSFLSQVSPVFHDYQHKDLPAIMTAIKYLTQMEGPMWKQIRGRGLAYNYGISLKLSSGMIVLSLHKSSQLAGAYEEGVNIINSHLNGSTPWRELLFESARSTLIYEIINREADITDVVQQSVYAYYRKVPHDYNRSLVKAINRVTIEDVDRASKKYFTSMLNPKLSRTVIVCPPSKVEEVQNQMKKFGHNIEAIDSLEDSRFSQL